MRIFCLVHQNKSYFKLCFLVLDYGERMVYMQEQLRHGTIKLIVEWHRMALSIISHTLGYNNRLPDTKEVYKREAVHSMTF